MATSEDVFLEDTQEFLTMGQFLKYVGLIGTGGQAKWFLSETPVFLNGEPEQRRGKKLMVGDEITVEGHGSYVLKNTPPEDL